MSYLRVNGVDTLYVGWMLEFPPLTEQQFQAYLQRTTLEYANDLERSTGMDAQAALVKSTVTLGAMLTNGLQTKNQFLHAIVVSNTADPIGTLWYSRRNNDGQEFAFIGDIHIEPDHRGLGYGTAVMNWLEDRVRAQGLSSIRLHVFGHNQGARNLYTRIGFEETNVMMEKTLD